MLSKKERDKLILDNIPFVKQYIRKYTKFADANDLLSEGILGLTEAAQKFDPNRGNGFLSYAVYYVRLKINNYLSSNNQYQLLTEDQLANLIAQNPDIDKINLNIEQKTLNVLEKLERKNLISKRDLNIIVDKYLSSKEVTLQDLATKYGVSRQRIEQIEKSVLEKIRKKL